MNERNLSLDVIKCLACIGVVGLHSVGMINYTIYYLCGISVPFFFMVNGYLMFSKEVLSYPYAARKIFYLLRIVVCWNILIMIPVLILRHKFMNPLSLCTRSLFQQGYLWHFWFFGSLILVYLVLPVLHKWLHNRPKTLLVSCLFLMLLCVFLSIFSMVRGYSIQMFVPQTLRLWTWLFYFLFGGLCTIKKNISIRRFPLWVHAFTVFILAFINNFCIKKIGLYLVHARLADLFYDNISSILWYTITFLFFLRIPIRGKAVKSIISILSPLTTGIFILHPIFLAGLSVFYMPTSTWNAVSLWIILVILSGLATYLINKIPVVRSIISTS